MNEPLKPANRCDNEHTAHVKGNVSTFQKCFVYLVADFDICRTRSDSKNYMENIWINRFVRLERDL